MFKKLLVLIFLTFFLVSCWDSDDVATTWLTTFQNTDFSIFVPWSWTIIKNDDAILPKPRDWEISLAVSSSDINYWFANNLLVLKQWLNKETTSRNFSIINNVWATWEYTDYVLLDSQDIVFSKGNDSKAYIFEAKYNETTPKLKFIQTSAVCWLDWYLLTIALALDTTVTDKYVDILKTFRCK